jgi:hypothetical protein
MDETLSNDPHLTDAELIEFSAGVVDRDVARQFIVHMEHCSECAAGISLLKGQLEVWQSPMEIERLEARIDRPRVMSDEEAPWWTRALNWVSITPLRQAFGAHAAGVDSEVIEFPVYENQAISGGLSGIIQRRGQEYQIRITPSREEKQEYRDRLVEVVLADLKSENVLLQRKIPIDRFVLLGTDLPIRTEKIAARLIL